MYPKEIMTGVVWSFVGGKYQSQEQFTEAVTNYHKKIKTGQWNPSDIAIHSKEITIQYSYWSNEEDDEVEEDFNLESITNEFTNAELLFKIHNAVVDKLANEDNHFFEGLTLWEGENYMNPKVPLYFLNQGS